MRRWVQRWCSGGSTVTTLLQSPLGLYSNITLANNVNTHRYYLHRPVKYVNMFKQLCVVIIAVLLLYDIVEGKKTKKTKRPTPEEDSAPQPDVVSYSTFGFNDVGTYEGFVPSSPDYTRLLTGTNDESSTKQLPSSFPTSVGSIDYGSNFGQQSFEGQPISVSNDGNSQPSFMHYAQNLNGFFNTPSFDTDMAQFKNAPDENHETNNEEVNAPVYGTKIGSKNKFKFSNQINYTDLEVNNDEKNDDKYNFNFNDAQLSTFENKPAQSEFSNSFQNIPTFPSTSGIDFGKTASGDTQNPFKFPRVVDFTKIKPFYHTEPDSSQFPSATPRPEGYDTSASAPGNTFANVYGDNSNNKKPLKPTSPFKDIYEHNTNDDESENQSVKSYTYSTKNNIYNYSSNTEDKPHLQETKYSSESKKKLKNKPWASGSYNFKKWKEPSPVNGYDYATNFSNTSFRYGVAEPKKPFSSSSIDEIVPASSNLDFTKYQFPEMDYSRFKKIPSYKVHEDNEFDGFPSYKEVSPFKDKPSPLEFNQNKHLFSPESTASSYWGNSYKSSDFSLFKNQANKHLFNDGANDEIVNIQPRRPNKFASGNTYESKPQEWSQFSRRPSKTRPWNDWTKEVSNKFKSEEDLLGLRNHDTSLPSYLPTYQSSNNYVSDEHDYKKLVDKWRQSYLKSKYKESLRDYESFASEAKPMHVPVPKPYPVSLILFYLA